MAENRGTMYAGEKEFAFHKIPAFAANNLLLKIQKIALPVLGALFGSAGKAKNVMDMDVSEAGKIIAEHVDEKMMHDIIMPLFVAAEVISVTDKTKINSEAAFNKVFTVDELGTFYELVFEVLKHNYAGFFTLLATRFGGLSGNPATPE